MLYARCFQERGTEGAIVLLRDGFRIVPRRLPAMPERSRTFVLCMSILHSLVSAQLNVPSPQVFLQGRFGGAQGAQSSYAAVPLLISWPASAVVATFVGGSVKATLTALPPTVTSNAYCRFAFNIDERQADIKSVTVNERTIQWSATDLSPGGRAHLC